MAVPFIMPADAVREVIYPQTRKINVAKQTIKANKDREAQKDAERNAWRLQNGWLDVSRVMMPNEVVDRAMEQEKKQARISTPRYMTTDEKRTSARMAAKMEADKKNEEAVKAVSTMLSLPMPSTYVSTGNSYLDTMMDMAVPFGLGRVAKGFNVALKASPSIGRAIVSGGKAAASPRAVTNFALQSTPFIAAAADDSEGLFLTQHPALTALLGYGALRGLRGSYKKWFAEPKGRPVLKTPEVDASKFRSTKAYQKEYDRQMQINEAEFKKATEAFEKRDDVIANARRRKWMVPETKFGKINRWVIWPGLIGTAAYETFHKANNTSPSPTNDKKEKTDTIQVIAPEYYDAPIQQSVDTTSTESLTLY